MMIMMMKKMMEVMEVILVTMMLLMIIFHHSSRPCVNQAFCVHVSISKLSHVHVRTLTLLTFIL